MKPGQGEPCPPSLRDSLRRNQTPALGADCPHCKAPAGRVCHGPTGRRLANPHASRWEAAGLKPQLLGEQEAS